MTFYIIKLKLDNSYVKCNAKYKNDYTGVFNIQDATWFESNVKAKEFAECVVCEPYEIHVLNIILHD